MLKGFTALRSELLRLMTNTSECYWCDGTIAFPQQFICQQCAPYLPRTVNPCRRCGNAMVGQPEGGTCGQCVKSPPLINHLISVFDYRYPIDSLITQFKFQRKFELARWFSNQLADEINRRYRSHSLDLPDAIVAVPLHSQRMRQRGYNQSMILARRLSHLLALPLSTSGIERCRPTSAQSGLSQHQRRDNMTDAFAISAELPRHVALVDDVITTGTTINELAKQCMLAGSERVSAWVLAHAPLVK